MSPSRLVVVPTTLRQANKTIDLWHRHHGSKQGHKYSLGVVDELGVLRGVAVVARPVAVPLDDGLTAEVARLATDGCPNACSALYAASWRSASAMGYRRIGTYILGSESGVSLRAAGWRFLWAVRGQGRDRPSRRRVDKCPTEAKQYWGQGDWASVLSRRQQLEQGAEDRVAV